MVFLLLVCAVLDDGGGTHQSALEVYARELVEVHLVAEDELLGDGVPSAVLLGPGQRMPVLLSHLAQHAVGELPFLAILGLLEETRAGPRGGKLLLYEITHFLLECLVFLAERKLHMTP